MTASRAERNAYFQPLLASGVLALLLAAWTWILFPQPGQSREIALADVLASQSVPASGNEGAAAALCEMWTGLPLAQVDCQVARRLADGQPTQGPDSAQAWSQTLALLSKRLQALGALAASLDARQANEPNASLTQIQQHLQRRLDDWNDRLARLPLLDPSALHYRQLFGLTLEVHGQVYDASRNRIAKVNWHIARALDAPSPVTQRAHDLRDALRDSSWLVGGLTLALTLTGAWRGGWLGWGVAAGVSTVAWLGLLVTADASVRFGEGSGIFTLNPLGNQLVRQHQVWLIMAGALLALALSSAFLRRMVTVAGEHLSLTLALLLLGTGAGYALMGPAVGSESLKISVALAAALTTAHWGRAAHLAGQIAPAALSARLLPESLRTRQGGRVSAQAIIARSLGRAVWQFSCFCALAIALAALVFHDLGAALVTAVVSVCALFFVFGWRIAAAVVAAMSLASLALSQTSKVQGRIALMLDPLGASISDFARLVAYAKAAHANGFPLGEIAWCSGAGACLPLQALSDYMPTVVAGLFGFQASLAFFIVFLLALLAAGGWLLRQYLTGQGARRTLAMTAFYLLLATATQTVVTFLGNWRVIPLTGLGAPLLSIGLSSALAPAIAAGLILHLQGERAQEGQG